MTRYCRNCGNALAESVAICAVCGAEVEEADGEEEESGPRDPEAASFPDRRRPFEAVEERPRPADRKR